MKQSGFTLIEVLIASSLLLSFITMVIPITSKIQTEQHILFEKRNVTQLLHEELQPFLKPHNKSLPVQQFKKLDDKMIDFEFFMEDNFMKGCAKWLNAKNQTETACLYGIPHE